MSERLSDAFKEKGIQDVTLRPKNLEEFVGQSSLKEQISILIAAAKGRNEHLEHILLYGNPGLGKTTLAHIIANEMNVPIRISSGPALERVGDIAAILTNLESREILFLDEIHRLSKVVEEILYPAMEEFSIDLVVGKGPSARTLRLSTPPFTLIGATTKLSLLSAPLRDRFGAIYHINFYTENDIQLILERTAKILNIESDKSALKIIAQRSRRTPRIANRLLRRVRDYAEVKARGKITEEVALKAMEQLEIDSAGLDEVDRTILSTIVNKFNGGPVGIEALAAATREEVNTIEEIYEPYLLEYGFIERTSRGRMITKNAMKHLGIKSTTLL